MVARQSAFGVSLLLLFVLGLTGCEPYLSMTDQVPAQTRQATLLLPESPRYVGMVDLETVLKQVDEFGGVSLLDSLRHADDTRLGTFFDATGLSPKTDLKAVYGAVGEGTSFSAVIFADLNAAQIDRYLEEAPEQAGRVGEYRDIPTYHLLAGSSDAHDPSTVDTVSVSFVRSGVIAVAMEAKHVRAMIDRHLDQTSSFRDNKEYMRLVERVGHGSTAWLAGRDVLQSALRDSTVEDSTQNGSRTAGLSGAGIQHILSQWSDRVLGLSEASSSLGGRAGSRVERLKSRIREQAVSVTLTDGALEGEVYLTMQDDASATNVTDLARGVLAALKLSEDRLTERHRSLLDEVTIDRKGPVVHVQFAVSRTQLEETLEAVRDDHGAAHRSEASIRRSNESFRRLSGITVPETMLKAAPFRL